jgi:hypothetical protein
MGKSHLHILEGYPIGNAGTSHPPMGISHLHILEGYTTFIYYRDFLCSPPNSRSLNIFW